MNHLELSSKQRTKLLEMCNTLFPEYRWSIPTYHLRGFLLDEGFPNFICHWFEFCIRTLANKIYDLQYSLEVQADILAEDYYKMIMNKHPVDYLYEEFEKLTPNTNEQ